MVIILTLTKNNNNKLKTISNESIENILVIGDTHIPFVKSGYLEFCNEQKKKYKCTKIIHVGDLVDNHSNSYHEVDPDGLSPKSELNDAKEHIKEWYKTFPKMEIILGNHDRLIQRKAFSAGLSQEWIKGYAEVLGTPNWNFHISYQYGNMLFLHGEGGKAITKAINRRISIIQGHYHTQSSIEYNVSNIDIIFGMQIGCGIDDHKYAFNYAKDFTKKSILSCGVIINNGTLPILIPMPLK